jgi:hypothetical protein
MRTTSATGSGTFARDLFVLDDVTLQVNRIDTSTFPTDRVIDQATLGDGRVVYVAAQDTAGVFELYIASPAGGNVTKLNPPLVANGNVQAGLVVNGTIIVYRADQDVAGQIELYAVSANAPGSAAKLNSPLVGAGRVSQVVAISDDGSQIAYVADQDTLGLDEAYLVALATPGVTTKLNAPVVRGVWDLQLSGDGRFVAYRNDDGAINNPQLFVVATARPQFAIHVDNQLDPGYVAQDVYRIANNELFYTGSSTFLEAALWSAPLGGLIVPSAQVIAGGANADVRAAFAIDAARNTIYYRQTEAGSAGFFEQLFAAPTAGGSAVALSAADVPVADFALSPDGKHVAFRTGGDGAEGGIVTRGTNGPQVDSTLAPAIDELDLTAMTGSVELGSDANNGIAAGYVLLDDGRCVFLGDLAVAAQQNAFLASGAWTRASRSVRRSARRPGATTRQPSSRSRGSRWFGASPGRGSTRSPRSSTARSGWLRSRSPRNSSASSTSCSATRRPRRTTPTRCAVGAANGRRCRCSRATPRSPPGRGSRARVIRSITVTPRRSRRRARPASRCGCARPR